VVSACPAFRRERLKSAPLNQSFLRAKPLAVTRPFHHSAGGGDTRRAAALGSPAGSNWHTDLCIAGWTDPGLNALWLRGRVAGGVVEAWHEEPGRFLAEAANIGNGRRPPAGNIVARRGLNKPKQTCGLMHPKSPGRCLNRLEGPVPSLHLVGRVPYDQEQALTDQPQRKWTADPPPPVLGGDAAAIIFLRQLPQTVLGAGARRG